MDMRAEDDPNNTTLQGVDLTLAPLPVTVEAPGATASAVSAKDLKERRKVSSKSNSQQSGKKTRKTAAVIDAEDLSNVEEENVLRSVDNLFGGSTDFGGGDSQAMADMKQKKNGKISSSSKQKKDEITFDDDSIQFVKNEDGNSSHVLKEEVLDVGGSFNVQDGFQPFFSENAKSKSSNRNNTIQRAHRSSVESKASVNGSSHLNGNQTTSEMSHDTQSDEQAIIKKRRRSRFLDHDETDDELVETIMKSTPAADVIKHKKLKQQQRDSLNLENAETSVEHKSNSNNRNHNENTHKDVPLPPIVEETGATVALPSNETDDDFHQLLFNNSSASTNKMSGNAGDSNEMKEKVEIVDSRAHNTESKHFEEKKKEKKKDHMISLFSDENQPEYDLFADLHVPKKKKSPNRKENENCASKVEVKASSPTITPKKNILDPKQTSLKTFFVSKKTQSSDDKIADQAQRKDESVKNDSKGFNSENKKESRKKKSNHKKIDSSDTEDDEYIIDDTPEEGRSSYPNEQVFSSNIEGCTSIEDHDLPVKRPREAMSPGATDSKMQRFVKE
eukprot:GDKJ01036962.1.p1 GENE.GDKJ01036962.1~~GDKJ01036962.1.p1  ORF type:complete len:617 (-),score=195.58 GDKJ01036962.1:142-1821(-)